VSRRPDRGATVHAPVAADDRPPAIYFLSDYGLTDEFVGVVHAVLHRSAPGVPVIDLTHQVPPFDVASGAATLARASRHLGPGVVLAVVDPGVATERRGVAVAVAVGPSTAMGPTWLVGPDNGLLPPAADRLGGPVAAVELTPTGRSTFDGRDRFAPAAAHLAMGGDPSRLGSEVTVTSLVRLPSWPADRFHDGGLRTAISHVDTFGNVQLRAQPSAFPRLSMVMGKVLGVTMVGSDPAPARWVGAFADLAADELGILVDSDGQLALVLAQASAAERLGLGPSATGTEVILHRIG